MHPDAAKQLARLVDEVDAGRLPESAIPRLFYQGHTLLEVYEGTEAKWECVSCNHQWIAENGTKCPACEATRESPE